MTVLETLALIGAIGGGTAQLGGFVSTLVGGAKANKETEKAQAYQEKWSERLYEDQMRQQALQNKLNAESAAQGSVAQRFAQEMSLRNEARKNNDQWYQTMQGAANKYAEILNKTKTLQQANAAALRNR